MAPQALRAADCNANGFDDTDDLATRFCEPDDIAPGDVMSFYCPGVDLWALPDLGLVYSATSDYASTGDQVFAPSDTRITWGGDTILLADLFTGPVASVSIDVIGDDPADLAYLEAYDAGGNLLERVESDVLGTGQVQTLTIARPVRDIAYVLAAGAVGQNVLLDRLTWRRSPDCNTNNNPDECDAVTPYQRTKVREGSGGDRFGSSIAVAPPVAVVGSPYDDPRGTNSGSAYVYVRRPNGQWLPQTTFFPSDTRSGDFFGYAVAIGTDYVAVGAYGRDDGPFDSGIVYVFVRSDDAWFFAQGLRPDDAVATRWFGYSLAADGDLLVVGAPYDSEVDSQAGAVYVFARNGNRWDQQAKLTASDGQPRDNLGWSVAIDGDTVLAGAPGRDARGADSGAVYVFRRQAGTWVEEAQLIGSDTTTSDNFGTTVSLYSDLAVVGPAQHHHGQSYAGAAWVFARDDAGTWTENAELLASDRQSSDYFGSSVAIFGDLLAVGAPGDDDRGTDSGSTYLFSFVGGQWVEQIKLTALDGASYDEFGRSLALGANFLWIGSPRDDDRGTDSGSAYVFRTSDDCNTNGVPDLCDIDSGFSDDCNASGLPDECELAEGLATDCNTNGIPDDCDIASGSSDDCDANGLPDECQPPDDCNANGIPDFCDLASGTSQDCNANDIPDECETFEDCNANGLPDPCDIAYGTSEDCNTNGVPDECETFDDCNGNGVPDSCDILGGFSEDCNNNGVPDECEEDCNTNGIPDDCDIADGTSEDCDTDGVPDECQEDCNANSIPDTCDIRDGRSQDCNANTRPDECDLAEGASQDCNTNSVPDECEPDCNANGVADECDIANGDSADCHGDGIPDECQIAGDLDSDGDVDVVDFSTFAPCFLGTDVPCQDACCLADLDCDGDVDIVDFSIFTTNYTGSW